MEVPGHFLTNSFPRLRDIQRIVDAGDYIGHVYVYAYKGALCKNRAIVQG